MEKITALVKRLLEMQFVRFAMVGGTATAINYGVYVLMIFEGLEPNPAYLVAFAVSLTCNFFLSSWFTFRTRPCWRRALRFAGAHSINLCNEMLLLNLFLWLGVAELLAPVFVFALAFPINYFMVRFALRGKWLPREE